MPANIFVEALLAQLPKLRRYAIALTGQRAMADDLVQDTLERALRSAAQLRDPALIAPWLRRILRNRFLDELRARAVRGPVQDIADLADDLALSVPGADAAATRDLVRAMNGLSVDHREILLLSSLEQLSYREIAAELELPLGTVMSRLARAREQLREKLEDYDDRH